MNTTKKDFQFQFPICKTEGVKMRAVTTHVCDITVEGVVTQTEYPLWPNWEPQYSAEVVKIIHDGRDITSLFKALDPIVLLDINEAAEAHGKKLFQQENKVFRGKLNPVFEMALNSLKR